MIRIAVFDDSISRLESLKSFIDLMPELEWAGGFENCDRIIQNITDQQPDIILMDIEMPGVNGLQGLIIARKAFPQIKIIMQTAFDDDDKIFTALQSGAEGYILKSASVLQIMQSIDEVMKGGASMSPSIALKVMRHFADVKTDYNLTPKELEVLKQLSIGLSYKLIADKLGVSYFTVNNHIKKIYEKLQVHSLGEAVAMAHKQKLV